MLKRNRLNFENNLQTNPRSLIYMISNNECNQGHFPKFKINAFKELQKKSPCKKKYIHLVMNQYFDISKYDSMSRNLISKKLLKLKTLF